MILNLIKNTYRRAKNFAVNLLQLSKRKIKQFNAWVAHYTSIARENFVKSAGKSTGYASVAASIPFAGCLAYNYARNNPVTTFAAISTYQFAPKAIINQAPYIARFYVNGAYCIGDEIGQKSAQAVLNTENWKTGLTFLYKSAKNASALVPLAIRYAHAYRPRRVQAATPRLAN